VVDICAVGVGFSGPLSPCGSTISAAPTIPSAPLSPADSELFGESRFFLQDIAERSDTSTPVPSSAADTAVCSFADSVKSMASSYQFEGTGSRATTSSYQVADGSSRNVGGNFIGSATWSPQSTLVNPARGQLPLVKGCSYSHLRYPPLVLYLTCKLLKIICYLKNIEIICQACDIDTLPVGTFYLL